MTIKRGRILRDTTTGEGLVFVDGNQHAFRLEGMWKSEYAPKVNMTVDVEFDDAGRLVALRNVSGGGGAAGKEAVVGVEAGRRDDQQVGVGEEAGGLLDAGGDVRGGSHPMAAPFQNESGQVEVLFVVFDHQDVCHVAPYASRGSMKVKTLPLPHSLST